MVSDMVSDMAMSDTAVYTHMSDMAVSKHQTWYNTLIRMYEETYSFTNVVSPGHLPYMASH